MMGAHQYCNIYCGGTDCDAPPSYTSTEPRICRHANGWWVVVKFWIFSKRVFVCGDCGQVAHQGGLP